MGNSIIKLYSKMQSRTGQNIEIIKWLPSTKPKAILQIVHGMAEHLERYDALANFLAAHSFIVIGATLPGHGKQAKLLGYFAENNAWNSIVADVEQIGQDIKKEYPDIPYFILGHSMGSFILRTYLLKYSNNLNGAILSGTGQQSNALVKVGKIIAKLQMLFGGAKKPCNLLNDMGFKSFNKQFAPNRTEYDWLSRDEKKVDEYVNDKYCGFIFTASAFYDVFTGFEQINNMDLYKNINTNLPIYIFSGSQDPVGNKGVFPKEVYNNYVSLGIKDIKIKLYDGGRHEMINEINREEVYADVLNWINEHI